MLEAFGDHEGDRLAVTRHLRAGQHRVCLAVIAGALRGRVAMSEDQRDARRLFRSTRVNRSDRSFSDRGFDHKAIQHVLLLRLIGVARAAGNLQSTVYAIDWLADNALCIEDIRADG